MAIRFNSKRIFTDTADIYDAGGPVNSCGIRPSNAANLTKLTTSPVACRILPMKGPREFKSGKKMSISQSTIFVMPWIGPAGQVIDEHKWFEVNGKMYNVIEAVPPPIDGAPFELVVERVEP
jgi:hypothetical protein